MNLQKNKTHAWPLYPVQNKATKTTMLLINPNFLCSRYNHSYKTIPTQKTHNKLLKTYYIPHTLLYPQTGQNTISVKMKHICHHPKSITSLKPKYTLSVMPNRPISLTTKMPNEKEVNNTGVALGACLTPGSLITHRVFLPSALSIGGHGFCFHFYTFSLVN